MNVSHCENALRMVRTLKQVVHLNGCLKDTEPLSETLTRLFYYAL